MSLIIVKKMLDDKNHHWVIKDTGELVRFAVDKLNEAGLQTSDGQIIQLRWRPVYISSPDGDWVRSVLDIHLAQPSAPSYTMSVDEVSFELDLNQLTELGFIKIGELEGYADSPEDEVNNKFLVTRAMVGLSKPDGFES